MSEEKPPEQSKPPAPKANPVVMIGVVVGALVAGAATGGLLVGPRLVASKSVAPHGAAAEKESEGGGGEKGKGGKTPVYKIENVIVNPSGSQGMHFLMASVAVEVPSSKIEERLREHDAELRDLTITILERQTLQELGLPGSRERIKRQLLTAMQPLIGTDTNVRMFLPQFVIQ